MYNTFDYALMKVSYHFPCMYKYVFMFPYINCLKEQVENLFEWGLFFMAVTIIFGKIILYEIILKAMIIIHFFFKQ